MKITVTSGATLAAAAAALVIGATLPSAPAEAANYKVKCFGLNACKGTGACKSLGNACKGNNACKGQGVKMLSKSACVAKGGKTSRG
jgi:uncharacterized membrane protein